VHDLPLLLDRPVPNEWIIFRLPGTNEASATQTVDGGGLPILKGGIIETN